MVQGKKQQEDREPRKSGTKWELGGKAMQVLYVDELEYTLGHDLS